MHILTRNYEVHSEHNFLLLLSLLFVMFISYGVIKSSKFITISPIESLRVQEKVLSIIIAPAPVVKKQEVKVVKPKPIKKIIKKKVIPIKTQPVVMPVVEPVVEPIVKQTAELITEPVVQKTQPVQTPKVPLFDAQMKASFIAGLYEMLNEKKYYPKMAKRRKLEGTAEVSFTLCKDGTIKDIFLHKSCGHKILDRAALKVVKSIDIYKAIPDAVSMASLNLNIPIKYSRN